MPGGLTDMPQPADFGGFYYDPASNLLAYRAWRPGYANGRPNHWAKFQHSSMDLMQEPKQNLPDLDNRILHR
jgi:hypothetical protein